jgi:hypothetical protein
MKKQKIIYWVSTSLFCLWMIANAFAYLTSEKAKVLCIHFGFPDYFRIELAFAKIIGVVILLLPVIKGNLKEWTYAGFSFTVISGLIAHVCSGDGLLASSLVVPALALLLASYVNYHKLQAKP